MELKKNEWRQRNNGNTQMWIVHAVRVVLRLNKKVNARVLIVLHTGIQNITMIGVVDFGKYLHIFDQR